MAINNVEVLFLDKLSCLCVLWNDILDPLKSPTNSRQVTILTGIKDENDLYEWPDYMNIRFKPIYKYNLKIMEKQIGRKNKQSRKQIKSKTFVVTQKKP